MANTKVLNYGIHFQVLVKFSNRSDYGKIAKREKLYQDTLIALSFQNQQRLLKLTLVSQLELHHVMHRIPFST